MDSERLYTCFYFNAEPMSSLLSFKLTKLFVKNFKVINMQFDSILYKCLLMSHSRSS